MSEIIIGSLYHQILDNLLKEIDLSILPLYGENEIYRMNSDRYGKVKIKLDIEKDTEKIEYAPRCRTNPFVWLVMIKLNFLYLR